MRFVPGRQLLSGELERRADPVCGRILQCQRCHELHGLRTRIVERCGRLNVHPVRRRLLPECGRCLELHGVP